MSGFRKDDQGKPKLYLLPPRALEAVGRVLTFGAEKYGPENWRRVADRTRYVSAALRHMFAYMRKEDRDADTGERHLAHAICCLLFLLELAEEEDAEA